MGMDVNFHVGPYVIFKGKKTIKSEEVVKTCSNKECNVNKLNKEVRKKFCSECGSPVEDKEYDVETVMSAGSYYRHNEEFSDELSNTEVTVDNNDVFISNENSPFKTKSENEYVADLTNVNIKEEIEWFKTRYKKIFDYIKKEFGEDSVLIKWGTVEWWS